MAVEQKQNLIHIAIDRALQDPGNDIAETLRRELSEVVADAAASFMAKHLSNEQVTNDFENFLRSIGVMRAISA